MLSKLIWLIGNCILHSGYFSTQNLNYISYNPDVTEAMDFVMTEVGIHPLPAGGR